MHSVGRCGTAPQLSLRIVFRRERETSKCMRLVELEKHSNFVTFWNVGSTLLCSHWSAAPPPATANTISAHRQNCLSTHNRIRATVLMFLRLFHCVCIRPFINMVTFTGLLFSAALCFLSVVITPYLSSPHFPERFKCLRLIRV